MAVEVNISKVIIVSQEQKIIAKNVKEIPGHWKTTHYKYKTNGKEIRIMQTW